MTVEIAQRGKAYLETGRSVLGTAQTMIDSAIAGRLKALARDCQWQAEKISRLESSKALSRSAAKG